MKRLETIEVETEYAAGDHADRRLAQACRQTEWLLAALHEARDEIAALREKVDRLAAPPLTYGVYLAAHEDDTVDILAQGRKMRVRLHPAINATSLRPGQELVLNESLMSSPWPDTRSRATSSCSRRDSTMSARW